MSILDDAIREHLELKRQHGAPDDEVQKLEDEAFGPPARPDDLTDPLAEAPTEFMTTPEAEAAAPQTDEHEAEGRRVPDIADLQEAPPAPEPEQADALAEEDQPAMEHEVIAEPPPDAPPETLEDDSAASHTTQERHAIAEQPTEMFDVESELSVDTDEPDSEVIEPPAAAEPAPTDEELLASELEEPRFAADSPAAPTPADPAPAFDEEDDFFDEQRLSDELDQALEAPAPASPPTEEYDEPVSAEHETVSEEHEVASEEHEAISEEQEQPSEEHALFDNEAEEGSSAEHEVVPEAAREQGHEDVLEDTPDFLEESPEDDQLWFEQKSPKDFDFGD